MTGGPAVLPRRSGAVLELTLSHPAKRNALTPGMLTDLADLVETAGRDDEVRVVVVRGAGATFSSGYALASLPEPATLAEGDELTRAAETIWRCPKPTVAALNGDAIGAAFDLALAADFRLAVAAARVGITPAKFGLVYSWQGIQRACAVLGLSTARRLLLTGELLTAADAHGLGAVHDVAPDADGLEELLGRWTARLSSAAPLSTSGTKHILRLLVDHGTPTEAEREEILALRRAALGSRDVREALDAFQARRTPRFVGR